jgi:prepilin-type N-terminal cleavage/methylation domain-containing protein
MISHRSVSKGRIGAKNGFTLIELLVVVAVIAVLASLLLPALNTARRQAMATVSLSNVRQLGLSVVAHATDNDGVTGDPVTWAHTPNAYIPQGEGWLIEYLDVNTQDVVTCPLNQRRGADGRELNFDYTMHQAMHFIRLSAPIQSAYFDKAAFWDESGGLTDPGLPVSGGGPVEVDVELSMLPAPLMFIEENVYFHNTNVPDGCWGTSDQITTRHFGGGHVAFLDGSARRWDAPGDRDPTSFDESTDIQASDIFIRRVGHAWVNAQTGFLRYSVQPGWANNPK